MAAGDITLLRDGAFGNCGSRLHNVAAAGTTIKAGEPVEKVLGAAAVIPATNNFPNVAGGDRMVGIATSTSTNTGAAAGTVQVLSLVPGQVFLIAPKVAATWDTQAEYDALVGDRVLIDLTGSTYTILAADNADYGCVVEPLDIKKYPGKVAFSVRDGASYLA